jgi:3-hydroxyacyl-[acyl-carrier-protein] dehydratase
MELESTLEFAADHPAFAGHFPGTPIVPGVLLLDAAIHAMENALKQPVAGIASAKFLHPVGPGEALHLACRPGGNGRSQFEITLGTQRAAAGQLLMGEADERQF